MSAPGQLQTSGESKPTSALRSEADIRYANRHDRFGPEAALRQVCSAPISEADGPSVARAGASWDRLSERLGGGKRNCPLSVTCVRTNAVSSAGPLNFYKNLQILIGPRVKTASHPE